MNAPDLNMVLRALPDVQSSPDPRRLAIQRVGVKGVRHPVLVRTGDGGFQPSVATFDLDVALPPEVKGTHMSRFVEILDANLHTVLDASGLRQMFAAMLKRLEADQGQLGLRFTYFRRKTAPVSGVSSLLDYEVQLNIRGSAEHPVVEQTVVVPVTSLCPCSKEISEYGAHNQRSHLTLSAETDDTMHVDALIDVAEQAASCQVWGLLKRPDEKYVTERAYDNPKFVEDLVRDVALALRADTRVQRFAVESENFESIHNHSAWARLEG